MRSFYGNVGVLVRAYAYIRALGADGLDEVAEQAVAVRELPQGAARRAPTTCPYDRTCMHEFVLSGRRQKRENGVRTLDIAKRLLDYGFHPPTIYFPLIVDEAIMIEPTETESLETLDAFADGDARHRRGGRGAIPRRCTTRPTRTPVRRLDEARAVKDPQLRYAPPCLD